MGKLRIYESRVGLYQCNYVMFCKSTHKKKCKHAVLHKWISHSNSSCRFSGCIYNDTSECKLNTILNVNDESVLALPEGVK